jgi:glutamine synthetase
MPANMTFSALNTAIKAREIDTVITCACDMQGRLQGKRFHAMHFIESAYEETHCCNYLFRGMRHLLGDMVTVITP